MTKAVKKVVVEEPSVPVVVAPTMLEAMAFDADLVVSEGKALIIEVGKFGSKSSVMAVRATRVTFEAANAGLDVGNSWMPAHGTVGKALEDLFKQADAANSTT